MNRIWSIIIAIIIWLIAPTIIFGWIFEINFANPQNLKETLSKTNAYQTVISEAPQYLANNFQPKFSQSDWTNIVNSTFTASDIQKNTENIIDTFYNYGQGKSNNFSSSINLVDYKTKAKPALVTAVKSYLATLSACTSRQNQELLLNPNQALTCRPFGLAANNFSATLYTDQILKNIPDNYTIAQPQNSKNKSGFLNSIKTGLIIATIFFAMLLILFIILLRKEPKTLLRRFGILFVLIGFPLLVQALFLMLPMQEVFFNQIANSQKFLSPQLIDAIRLFTNEITKNIKNALLITSAIITGVGIISWVASAFLAKPVVANQPTTPAN
jgi:hypothetical protein